MTLAELARLAGVSRTTASYVMNGQGAARRIKPETIERVLALAKPQAPRLQFRQCGAAARPFSLWRGHRGTRRSPTREPSSQRRKTSELCSHRVLALCLVSLRARGWPRVHAYRLYGLSMHA